MDALSILNDPTFTPLGAGSGDPLAGSDNKAPEGFFIVIDTTLRVRSIGTSKFWLGLPYRLIRGGGRP